MMSLGQSGICVKQTKMVGKTVGNGLVSLFMPLGDALVIGGASDE
jgi:hypothetical protein